MSTKPTAGLRRLAAELKQLREKSGLTQEQVIERTGISSPSLWRLENVKARPRRTALLALLNLYAVSDTRRAELIEMYNSSAQQGWLARYQRILPSEYSAYIQFEAEAAVMSTFQGQHIPGLLQTADYADAVIRATDPGLTDEQRTKQIEARLTRQQEVLHGTQPVELWAIIDEAAIRRRVGGPDVMRAQREKLITDADLPNVTLQVIPFDAGAHAGTLGAFVVLDFPEPDPPVVYLEHIGGSVVLDDKDDVARFAVTFNRLRMTALNQEQSLELISSA